MMPKSLPIVVWSYLATPKIIFPAPPFAPAPEGCAQRYVPPPPVGVPDGYVPGLPSAFSPTGFAAEIWTQRFPVIAMVAYPVTSSPGRLYGIRSFATAYPSLALMIGEQEAARRVLISGNQSSGKPSPWSPVEPSPSPPGPHEPRAASGTRP